MPTNSGRGSKLARSETVTVRLDPKLRYLAELAARKQRRTLSSFIEWAIEDVLTRVSLDPATSVGDAAASLWDVDEPDRFARLAFNHPELLTHTEQVRWKLICEHGLLWSGSVDGYSGKFYWSVNEHSLRMDELRTHWDAFCKVASGQADKSILPEWEEYPGGPKDPPEIPF